MVMKTTLMTAVLLLLSGWPWPSGAAAADDSRLARRGDAGWTLSGPADATAGVEITALAAGSAAAESGLQVGDRLLSIDGQALDSREARARHLSRLPADRAVTLRLRRQDRELQRTLRARPAGVVQHPGRRLEMGSLRTAAGHRVRTWLTLPEGSAQAQPAVLLVKWLSCGASELNSPEPDGIDQLLIRLIRELPLAVLRVDPPGQGDSEGPACIDADFEAELAVYRAAFQALLRDPRIDSSRIYILGLSNGGAVAPLVDPQGQARGYMVSGGWLRSWYQHMLELEERRLALSGKAPAEIGQLWPRFAAFHYHYLYERLTPAAVAARYPSLAGLWYEQPNSQYGRPAAFYHQLQALNLREAWSRVAVPTLAVYGEHDWIMSRADHEEIVQLVNARRPGNGQLLAVPKMSHGFELHDSPQQAFDGAAGRFAEPAWAAIRDWLGERIRLDGSPAAAGNGLLDRARSAQMAGNATQARELAGQALQQALAAQDRNGEAAARLRLASIGIGSRDLDATVREAGLALAIYQAAGDAVAAARAVNLRAVALDERGRRPEALQGYRRYLDTMLRHGSPEQIAWAQHNLAYFLWQKGELRAAEPLMREGLAYFQATGAADGRSALGRGLAAILRSAGDDAGADQQSALALAAAREAGSDEGLLMAYDKRISALVLAGRVGEAAPLLAEGEARAAQGWSRGHGDFGLGRLRYYLAAGDLDSARRLATELLARFEAEDYRLNLAHSLVLSAQVERLSGQAAAAEAAARRALEIATALDTAEPALQARLLLAALAESRGAAGAAAEERRALAAQAAQLGLAVRLPGLA